MKKSCLLGAMATLIILLMNNTQAAIVSVEPDTFAHDTDISTAFSGVTLSASGANVTGAVFSFVGTYPSTGSLVFGNSGPSRTTWGSSPGITFRADFSLPTDFVSIDMIPNDPSDSTTLRVYDYSDTLLASITVGGVTVAGTPEVASITWGTAEIAYMTIYSPVNNYQLDNLKFNAVPIPPTLWLFGSGLIGLVGIAKKKTALLH